MLMTVVAKNNVSFLTPCNLFSLLSLHITELKAAELISTDTIDIQTGV
jgi:hypothetical protein